MGSAKMAFAPAPSQENLTEQRERTRKLLANSVERASMRLAANPNSGVRYQAYAKALIRYNSFLLREKVRVQFQQQES